MMVDATAKIPVSKLEAGLYIVATPIGNLKDFTFRARDTLTAVDAIACEDTRVTHKLLDHYGIKGSMVAYNDTNGASIRPQLLRRMVEGQAIALVSDAGTPLISDPGYKLVREAREQGIKVTTIPGACAGIAALTLAALPTDRFLFAGFLPTKVQARAAALESIKSVDATLVFYERGSRGGESLAAMVAVLGKDREASVVREITKSYEETVRGTLGELAIKYAEEDARGEIVIVVGAPIIQETTQETLDTTLLTLMRDHSLKEAVVLATEALGMQKKLVYQRALELKGSQD